MRSGLLALFAFSGAVLTFGLEPLVGRLLLPAYGGGFQVWTTCLMFFQAVLFLASDRSAKTTGCTLTVDGGVKDAFPR